MRSPHKTALAVVASTLVLLPALGGLAAPAGAATPVGNCPDLDSGRVVVPGNQDQVVVPAPTGRTIVGYCLKSAGLRGTTGAPYQVALESPATSVVLKHRDGGNLTHYSLVYGTVPTTPTTPVEEEPEAPVEEEPEAPVEEQPETPATPPNPPVGGPYGFDWNWTYPAPSCTELTVPYPGDLPSGQANDVNVRIATDRGTRTLNFHNDETTWSGTVGFVFASHPQWPADVSRYVVEWVQVGGTNHHWQGEVDCVLGDVAPLAVTDIEGWRTQATVRRGRAASSDAVVVEQAGADPVVLQKRTATGTWRTVGTVAAQSDGDAVVRFPRETRRGTSVYRLRATGSEAATGDVSAPLRVRVTR